MSGLSSLRIIPSLKKLAQQYHPEIIFISETLAKARKLEAIRVILKFEACLIVDVDGRSVEETKYQLKYIEFLKKLYQCPCERR